jgi:hypothetical protein
MMESDKFHLRNLMMVFITVGVEEEATRVSLPCFYAAVVKPVIMKLNETI